MNIGTIIVTTLLAFLRAFFTRKVLFNLIVVLAEWAVKRTDNDLDDRLLVALKDGLDKRGGYAAGNLYDKVAGR